MFAMYCDTLADVAKTREELQSAEEEKDTLQQVLTYMYFSMVHANSDQELWGIVELFQATESKCWYDIYTNGKLCTLVCMLLNQV